MAAAKKRVRSRRVQNSLHMPSNRAPAALRVATPARRLVRYHGTRWSAIVCSPLITSLKPALMAYRMASSRMGIEAR